MSYQQTTLKTLLDEPLWRAEDLGKPLPPSPHANSVCLPTWADVVAYEEADPRVISRLQTGYPRFFIHPLTERLFAEAARRFAGPGEFCHVYPSEQPRGGVWSGAALDRTGGTHRRLDRGGTVGDVLSSSSRRGRQEVLAAYRRGRVLAAGGSVAAGSRRSRTRARPSEPSDSGSRSWSACRPIACCLFGSGMSAIYTVYRAINRIFPGRRSVQFGFPYVDTLKIQQDLGPGVHFFPRGD